MLREPEAVPQPVSQALDLGALSLRCLRHARWLGLPDVRAQAVWQLALRRSKIGDEARLDSAQQRDLLKHWFVVLDQSLTGLLRDSAMPMMQARFAFLRIVVGMPLQDIADCLRMPLPTAAGIWRDAAQLLRQRATQCGCAADQSLAWFRGLHVVPEDVGDEQSTAVRQWPLPKVLMLVLLCAVIGLALCEACLQGVVAWFSGTAQEGPLTVTPSPPRRVDESVPLSSGDFLLFADGVEFTTLDRLDWLLWHQGDMGQRGIANAEHRSMSSSSTTMPWDALAPGIRASLQVWESDWGTLAAAQRDLLVRHGARWVELNVAQQTDVLRRAAQWAELDPLRRAALRERFEVWRDLSDVQQQALLDTQDRLTKWSPEQLAVSIAEFERLAPAARRALLWQDGAGVAAAAESAFGFVPEGERDATLQMLGEWRSVERDLLVKVAQRLDSQAREQLRQRLLAAPTEQRIALLNAEAGKVGVAQ